MISIVDDIGYVVAEMRGNVVWGQGVESTIDWPFYIYGHPLEINNRLKVKDKDPVHREEKYPLVILMMDTIETVGNTVIDYNLNIVLVASSSKINYAPDRYEKVIKPMLFPMYDAFMVALYGSGLFTWQGQGEDPPCQRIVRPYWGNALPNKNDAYVLSDPLDAIEIKNLKINTTRSC